MITEFYSKLLNNFENSPNDFLVYNGKKDSFADASKIIRKMYSRLKFHHQKKILVYASKNLNNYCSIYSILFSRNIWVPVSPGMPDSRLETIVKILQPDLILYDDAIPDSLKVYPHFTLQSLVDDGEDVAVETLPFDEDELAYIMFTSGSTGTPKGVPMTHLNYINFVNNALEILPIESGEVFSDYHEFSFDISIFYLFCAPLTESAMAPILKNEEKFFPLKHAQDNKVTVWSSVPSMINSIKRLRPNDVVESGIKIMFLCGEPLPISILEYCIKNLKVLHNYNFYGLTETGVENFYHECKLQDLETYKEKGFLPIGRPLPGNQVKISDEKELMLNGAQLTPGYLGGIEKNRFVEIDNEIWYYTGDIVEQLDDVYFCKGRKDSQIKIGGYRIELMDIEANLRLLLGVKEAVCFIDERAVEKRLACCLRTEEGFNLKNTIEELRKKVPEYMVPKKYYNLSEIPLNENGKINRKKIKNNYFDFQTIPL